MMMRQQLNLDFSKPAYSGGAVGDQDEFFYQKIDRQVKSI